MRIATFTLAAALAAAGSSAMAQSGDDLLKKHGCNACHALDARLVGPSFKAVAEKYRGDAGAATRLAAKVKSGGAGVWGQMPMPPNGQVPDAELKQMVAYVLSLK